MTAAGPRLPNGGGPAAPRERGVEYAVTDGGDHWLALTNQGGATEFRLVTLPKKEGLTWEDAGGVLSLNVPVRLPGAFQWYAPGDKWTASAVSPELPLALDGAAPHPGQ